MDVPATATAAPAASLAGLGRVKVAVALAATLLLLPLGVLTLMAYWMAEEVRADWLVTTQTPVTGTYHWPALYDDSGFISVMFEPNQVVLNDGRVLDVWEATDTWTWPDEGERVRVIVDERRDLAILTTDATDLEDAPVVAAISWLQWPPSIVGSTALAVGPALLVLWLVAGVPLTAVGALVRPRERALGIVVAADHGAKQGRVWVTVDVDHRRFAYESQVRGAWPVPDTVLDLAGRIAPSGWVIAEGAGVQLRPRTPLALLWPPEQVQDPTG